MIEKIIESLAKGPPEEIINLRIHPEKKIVTPE